MHARSPANPAARPPDAGNVLYRSQIEIGNILHALASQGATLWACVEDSETLFLTRLLHVDPDGDHIVVSYSQEKPANDALLAAKSATFHAGFDKAYLEFVACHPSETVFEDANAVRFEFPAALLCSQRREHPRFRVAPSVPLRCIADSGGITPFEADIVDISLGGTGTVIYDTGIHLAKGTVLKNCKIVHPRGDALIVDLEVCHTGTVTQRNGELACRSGFRFLQQPDGLEQFIEFFILDLDQSPQL